MPAFEDLIRRTDGAPSALSTTPVTVTVPTPLRLLGRHTVVNAVSSTPCIVACGDVQAVHSSASAICMDFLRSQQAAELIRRQYGQIRIFVLEVGKGGF
jgi:hypothetical protein